MRLSNTAHAIARNEFKELVLAWAARIRVQPTQVRIQLMRRKWASCSPAGWVSFAADLLEYSREFRERVIVHELLHLRYRNHGKLFRAAERAYLGRVALPLTFEGDGTKCFGRTDSSMTSRGRRA